MKFDEECKVIIDSMDEEEAGAFVKFLISEIKRHEMDIDNAVKLIGDVREKFKLGEK